MKEEISSQQSAFFTQNGYLELEGIAYKHETLYQAACKILSLRCGTAEDKLSRIPSSELYRRGRDLWREESSFLKPFLAQKLFPFAAALSAKHTLRLGADQWIPSDYLWAKSCNLKELFSIQGLMIGALICFKESHLPLKASLGLLPLPSKAGNVLFFQPHLILDWPQLLHCSPTDMYLAAYALPNAIYIHNPQDPATNDLKQYGYGFGDLLKNEFHPLLHSKT
jgi:hypothetical protein